MVKIIQNYILHEQIGEGEYGKVFRGVDSRTKKEVAVKVINVRKFKQFPKLEECTLNEIEVLSKIESPHIVRFIEILKTANNFYFFYEYCNQGTLEDLIKGKGTLQEAEAVEYLSQILEAFRILTSKNIMHRDLKPSNILVHDGIIKIADFGFCKSLENQRDLAQTMLGSPIYMAPEVLKGEIYTIKADIWSLGVVLYQMLYGFCPFEERSIARLINLLEKEEVNFDQQINKISPELESLLRRMLVKDHFKRIGWKEIFEYRIKDKPLLPEQKAPSVSYEPARVLEEVKNLQNIVERPSSRNSFDFNYQDYSGSKPTNPGSQNPSSNPNFKKISQNRAYTQAPHAESQADKQNLQSKWSAADSSKLRSEKSRIKHLLKLAADVVDLNYCPEVTIPLCLKIYQAAQKEMAKLDDGSVSGSEKLALAQAIRQFQQEGSKAAQQAVSGPLLNYYIKSLQVNHRENFQPTHPNKQMIVHCLVLLDLHEASRGRATDYMGVGKEKLVSELYQKILKNVI